MPSFVTPAGGRRFREFNDCNLPGGGPDGGRFGANSDPRCGQGGQVGSPRERTPQGEDREAIFTTARRRYMLIRDALKMDPHATPDVDDMQGLLDNLKALNIPHHPDLTLDQKVAIENHRISLQGNLDLLLTGSGAYSNPDPSDKPGSGADVRERLTALMPLRRAVLDAKLADREATDAFDELTDKFYDVREDLLKATGLTLNEFPRYPFGDTGRRLPLDDGEALNGWLNDPTADPGEREERADLLERYETLAEQRQAQNTVINGTSQAWGAAEKTYREAVRGVLQLPESERIGPIQLVAHPSARVLLKDRAEDFKDATDFLTSISAKSAFKYPTATLLKRTLDDRSNASSVDNSINMNPQAGTSIIVHELVHHIEFNNRDVLQAAIDFRDSRVQTDKQVKLSSLVPGSGYKDHEMAYATSKRSFKDPYAGKVYPEYSSGRTIAYNARGEPEGATELLTMGVQALYEDPMKFAESDPDYFDFTIDVLQSGAKFAMRNHKDRVRGRGHDRRVTW